jgi:hypothetical protein
MTDGMDIRCPCEPLKALKVEISQCAGAVPTCHSSPLALNLCASVAPGLKGASSPPLRGVEAVEALGPGGGVGDEMDLAVANDGLQGRPSWVGEGALVLNVVGLVGRGLE